ncbi:MAG TPA: hypothetical protein VGN52_13175 [Burkholderiales bacterium]|jgi:hypothetical protein
MNIDQRNELLYQSLEHEIGGVKVYETALQCVVNGDLKEEWEKYLRQTRHHVEVMQSLCKQLGLDINTQTPGRAVVRQNGEALVRAMQAARQAGKPEAAQLVACECIVLAETKDHADWELIGQCADAAEGKERDALLQAYQQVEDEEDEHLYHTKGWCRELWLESLGLPCELPPPEEVRKVKTAVAAAKAETESLARRH